MLYYRVKAEHDNTRVYTVRKNQLRYFGILVGNEIKTENEYKNLLSMSAKDISDCFELVNVGRNKAYWSFGVRFAD